MTNKLVRNKSNAESRNWWKAIEAAARTAPRLDSPSESSHQLSSRTNLETRPTRTNVHRSRKK